MEGVKQGIELLAAFNSYNGSLETLFVIGFGLMSVLMTILKSDHIWKNVGYDSDVFSMIPKAYQRYIPLLLGAGLGLINGLLLPIGGIWQDVLMGVIVLGGGNQIAYHQLKGLPLGKLIEFALKTAIKK